MWVAKLFISPVKKRIFAQKRPNSAQNSHFCPLLAHLVPCWWVGWWLWRAGCISQDTYLLYKILSYPVPSKLKKQSSMFALKYISKETHPKGAKSFLFSCLTSEGQNVSQRWFATKKCSDHPLSNIATQIWVTEFVLLQCHHSQRKIAAPSSSPASKFEMQEEWGIKGVGWGVIGSKSVPA